MNPFPTTERESFLLAFWCAVLAPSLYFLAPLIDIDKFESWPILLAAFAFGLVCALPIRQMWKAVDPWRLQRALMVVSDQKIGKGAQLNPTSYLYIGLCLEELAELIRAVGDAVSRELGDNPGRQFPGNPLLIIQQALSKVVPPMELASLTIRRATERLPEDGAIVLTRTDAIEISDGTTDLAVTNAGFAIASGLPGADLYAEVQASNLSKVDPATGKIEKTTDGKWIKGPNYRKPNISYTLEQAGALLSDAEREELASFDAGGLR